MSLAKYLLIGVVPFNLIKGAVLTLVFLIFAKVLAPWLAKQRGMAQDSERHAS
jgi:riboflavin transporter FmnP